MVVGESAVTSSHVLFLHPLGVDLPSLVYSLLARLEYGLMLIKSQSTAAVMFGCKSTTSLAVGSLALSVSIGIMLFARVLAEALEVLGTDYSGQHRGVYLQIGI